MRCYIIDFLTKQENYIEALEMWVLQWNEWNTLKVKSSAAGKEFNFTATENKKNTVLSGFHPSPRKEI